MPHCIPVKPKSVKIDEVRNKSAVMPGERKIVSGKSYKIEFDLQVFGHTNGSCPRCGKKVVENGVRR